MQAMGGCYHRGLLDHSGRAQLVRASGDEHADHGAEQHGRHHRGQGRPRRCWASGDPAGLLEGHLLTTLPVRQWGAETVAVAGLGIDGWIVSYCGEPGINATK